MLAVTVLALVQTLTDPCALITPADVARTIGWDVTRGARRRYALPASSGTLCTYDGHDGTIVVTVAKRGDGLPINAATNGLAPVRGADELKGLGVSAEIGTNTVLVHFRSHDYGIAVQPLNADFSDPRELTELARAMVDRLRARTHVARPAG